MKTKTKKYRIVQKTFVNGNITFYVHYRYRGLSAWLSQKWFYETEKKTLEQAKDALQKEMTRQLKREEDDYQSSVKKSKIITIK